MRESFVIERVLKADIERVFDAFTTPEDLVHWHHAGDGWKTPYAEIDPVVGGKLKIGYSNADETMKFDLEAIIEKFERPNSFHYRLGMEMLQDDARLVTCDFESVDGGTKVRVEIDTEPTHSIEQQIEGWTQHIDYLEEYLAS